MVQKYLKAKEEQPLTIIVEFVNENELGYLQKYIPACKSNF